jgi:hypothetical protein
MNSRATRLVVCGLTLVPASASVIASCGGQLYSGAEVGIGDGSVEGAYGQDGGDSADAAATRDSGSDGGYSIVDASAYDATMVDSGTDASLDASPLYTFANPLQVDLSTFFNIDSVANTTDAGQSFPPLTEMDNSGNTFFTASAGTVIDDSSGGLPDNGWFASNTDHPDVQLAFSNASNALNSVLLNSEGPGPASVTFPVTATHYSVIQIYCASAGGTSGVSITLNYSDSSSDTASATIPNWFSPNPAFLNVFVLQDSLSRFSAAGFDSSDGYTLAGASASANSAKTLTSVTVGGALSRLVLYGATAY